MMNDKGQGALEYLIIVAAVLAIAAVVVVIVSGAFAGGQSSATVSQMKQDATDCAQALVAEGYEPGTSDAMGAGTVCDAYCDSTQNPRWLNYGDKVSVTVSAPTSIVSDAQDACYVGKPSWIKAAG